MREPTAGTDELAEALFCESGVSKLNMACYKNTI